METIKQQVQIPENHRLSLEVEIPPNIPAGPADVVVLIEPTHEKGWRERILSYAGCLADTPLAKMDNVKVQRELRDEWD
jgi:hypothetical protein